MPPSTVPRFTVPRLTILSLLSALLLMWLLPGARGVQASGSLYPGAAPGNPAINLTPSTGPGGNSIAVSGGGFAPHDPITLSVDGSNVATSCTANAAGSFSNCAFAVPPATGGTHTVTASDGIASSASAIYTASIWATKPVAVSNTASAAATRTGNPTVSLSSGAGKVGSNIAVSGSGFAAYTGITLSFDGSSVSTSCKTTANGSFRNCAVAIPAAAVGSHAVTASDSNVNAASAVYTINPGISLSPSAGLAGSSAAVSGSGYAPFSPITVTFDGHPVATSCKVNADGSFSNCAFTVPDVAAGTHTVTASASKTNSTVVGFYNSGSATYTVNPALSVDPASGNVGSTVTLNGSNYKANSNLTVTFDGAPLSASGTCTADAKGNLPASNKCAFTVPTATAGSYAVTVSDGTYTGSATYAVKPAIDLTSSAGAVGSRAAVSGSGFAPFSAVTLTFGDNNVGTATTNASGSFSNVAFTAPAATAGKHDVTVTDASGNAAADKYTVIPAISRTPSSGAVGSSVAINGTGFAPNSTISLTFGDSRVSSDCKTTAAGSFSPCAFTVPVATVGPYTVTASDGKNSAWVLYTVNPVLSLNPADPTAGTVGSTVILSGSNYLPNSSLTVKFNGASVSTSGTCTADAKGNLPATNNCAFTIPAVTAGSYPVTVSDGTYTGSATYTVNPALSLTPYSGPVGSGAGVSGSGFTPYSTITVVFDGSSVPTSCTADAKGSFSNCAFTIPAVSAGYHTVGATDGSTDAALPSNVYSASGSFGNYASAGYTVTPAFSLAPAAGAVGSTVTLSGSNYKADSSLTVTFDGTKLSTCTADAKGNLPTKNACAFTVPAATAGSHTVTVSDGTYTGSATYTVNPSIGLAPNSGPVNSTATVSGSGYAPYLPITLSFDGSSVSTSCTADASGSFSNCAFTVPAKIAGLHPVTASDGTNSGTALYTISPSIGLTPSAGAVGSKPAITGFGFAAYAPITVTFDGAKVNDPTTCIANASGKISGCAFTVPAATAGTHTVKATDGTNSVTTTYMVSPAIALQLSTSAGNTSVAVNGTGFAPGTITVTLDSTAVTSCKADATGSVSSCTFTVPTPAAGTHTVWATDSSKNIASAKFTI